jgi:signal transduction histidine kinase
MVEKSPAKKSEFSRFYPLFFTLVVVFILFQYSFSSLEAIFYDLRVKYDLGLNFEDNIVLVTMDEESDRFLGENYPYTYASHERLMSRLSIDGKPKLVAYLVNLEEPITDTEASAQERFRQRIIDYRVSGGGFRFGTDLGDNGELIPPRGLRDLGHSLSIINVDSLTFSRDEVTRRAILNISGDSSIHLWAANFARAKRGKANLDSSVVKGSYYLPEADATFFMYRYYDNPLEGKSRVKSIPFHRVAVGNFPEGYFENKIVIVGSRNIEKQTDFVLSAFNKEDYRTPKINIHAQIIQSLLQNKTVYQLPQLITYILCIVISIFLSFIVSILRPTRGLIITASVMIGVIFLSYLIFTIFGLWLYTTHLVLSVFVVYYIGVPFRAIGEHQRRYAIQEEAKLIKKVENLKQNFISLMSHDLKTPVAKIAGTADVMLQQHRSDKDLSKGLNYIIDSTKELNKFITSILDLTKIESRDITLNIASKDVNKLIESVVESLALEAQKKGMKINTELAPLYPIDFDQDLIRRVISNLVENAIKYSGEGTAITIRTEDDEKWVYISIEDNGAGIPANDLEHVFDKFYRVKNDASHVIKGSGLGLYLVKYFVELHGGKISVESELGSGTKFKVQLKNM